MHVLLALEARSITLHNRDRSVSAWMYWNSLLRLFFLLFFQYQQLPYCLSLPSLDKASDFRDIFYLVLYIQLVLLKSERNKETSTMNAPDRLVARCSFCCYRLWGVSDLLETHWIACAMALMVVVDIRNPAVLNWAKGGKERRL